MREAHKNRYEPKTWRFLCDLTAINGSKWHWNKSLVKSLNSRFLLTSSTAAPYLSCVSTRKCAIIQLRKQPGLLVIILYSTVAVQCLDISSVNAITCISQRVKKVSPVFSNHTNAHLMWFFTALQCINCVDMLLSYNVQTCDWKKNISKFWFKVHSRFFWGFRAKLKSSSVLCEFDQ